VREVEWSVESSQAESQRESGELNPLNTFGLFAVSAMVVCYALEERSHWFTLAFAGSCLLGSAYGFLQGAWPFGVVEVIWSGIALGRWWKQRRSS
jgi:hypothetical protein